MILIGLILALTNLNSASALDTGFEAAAPPRCEKPWVFFDLGADTLIDTGPWPFQNIIYHDGALAYLSKLKDAGFHLGLLVNVPPEWGVNQAEKLAKTQDVIGQAWKPCEATDLTCPKSFDWTFFDLRVRFNNSAEQRKDQSPYLFRHAARDAYKENCDAVYMGTLAAEPVSAWKNGMYGIPLTEKSDWDGERFYPIAKLIQRDFSEVCQRMGLDKCEPDTRFLHRTIR